MPRDTPGQADLLPRPKQRRRDFRLEPDRDPLEHDLQIACTKALYSVLLPDVCWTAIDHGHSLNMTIGRHGRPIGFIEAQKRKARGIKPGITDYLFWRLGRGFAIELKTIAQAMTANKGLSDDQHNFLSQLITAGVEVSVCWTIDLVLARCQGWGLCRPFRVSA